MSVEFARAIVGSSIFGRRHERADGSQHAIASTFAQRLSIAQIATDFPYEWVGIAAIVLIDVVWGARVGFTLSITLLNLLTLFAIFAAGVFFRVKWREERGALIAEYFVLTIVASSAFAVLSYLCCAVSLPLIDRDLLKIDQAAGFDWQHWFALIRKQPAIWKGFRLVYASIFLQVMYFTVLYGLLRNRARLREIFWVVFVTSAVTSMISVLMPALGTFEMFRLGDLGGYLEVMKQLRHGGNLHFRLEDLTGVISFPSFHTSMAVIYVYAFRRTGVISVAIAALNLLMLPCIPFIGGHYLVDMMAGIAVAIGSIAVVRTYHAMQRSYGTRNALLATKIV